MSASLDTIRSKLSEIEKKFKEKIKTKSSPEEKTEKIEDYKGKYLPKIRNGGDKKYIVTNENHNAYASGIVSSLSSIDSALGEFISNPDFGQDFSTDNIKKALDRLKDQVQSITPAAKITLLSDDPVLYVHKDVERYHEYVTKLIINCLELIKQSKEWTQVFDKIQTMDDFITTITHSKQEIVAFLQAIIPFN